MKHTHTVSVLSVMLVADAFVFINIDRQTLSHESHTGKKSLNRAAKRYFNICRNMHVNIF